MSSDRPSQRTYRDVKTVAGAALFAMVPVYLFVFLTNSTPMIEGFLAVVALPNEGAYNVAAGFLLAFVPPTLYLIGAIELWGEESA